MTAAAANSSSRVMPGDGRQHFETALLFLHSSLKNQGKDAERGEAAGEESAL